MTKTIHAIKTAIPIPYDQIVEFCEKWGIVKFELFGSILRDDFGPDSDVDVMVTYHDDAVWTFERNVDEIDELKEMFGREVDIVERGTIEQSRNPYIRREILQDATVIYES